MKLLKTTAAGMVCLALALVSANVSAITKPPNPLIGQAKAMHAAKVKLDDAKMVLVVLRHKLEVVYEVKPEWKTAKETLDKAKAEYDAATRKIIAGLEKVPAYKTQMAIRDKAQAVTDLANTSPLLLASASESSGSATGTATGSDSEESSKVTPEMLAKASHDRALAVFEMKRQEQEVEDADPNFITLKQKYTDAQTAWTALEQQVDDAVKLDPGYVPAMAAIQAAETAYQQARDQYAAAAKAKRDADEAAIKAKSRSGRR